MTIFELGALGEFVGSIGVIVTLIYLAVQIKHNTKALRSSTIETATERKQFELRWSSDISAAFVKSATDPDSLTPEESWQLTEWHNSAFLARHNEFLQYRLGLIDEETWRQSERIISFILGTDWALNWWDKAGKAVFDQEFLDEMDRIIGEKPVRNIPTMYGVED